MRPRLAWLLVLLALVIVATWRIAPQRSGARPSPAEIQAAVRRFTDLEAQAAAHDQTIWAAAHGAQAADDWWASWADTVTAAPEPFSAAVGRLARWTDLDPLRTTLLQDQAAGFKLERLTGRPVIDRKSTSLPDRSDYQLEFLESRGDERATIYARIATALPAPAPANEPAADDWSPVRLDLLGQQRNQQRAQFRPWAEFNLVVPTNTRFADPLLFREGPMGPELILISTHERWRWERLPSVSKAVSGRWVSAPSLIGLPADHALAAALADTDGDGLDDLWLAGRAGLWWAQALPNGDFAAAGLRWASPEPLIYPQALAIADADHDRDLEVWVTQYKNPYQKGQFPTPYFDANDGFASYLLRNEGTAGFADITAQSGVNPKRRRRTYSASWLDLNGDGAVDLINVSDFAGLDVYLGDGRGGLRDITASLGEARHAFGMAHAVTDWNGDERPDLLLVGMESAWAARLNGLDLGRSDFPAHSLKRAPMTWGNRVFLGAPLGVNPEQGVKATTVARAGWAWGGAELDVENDGRADFFFANGHETRASQRDYERQFWLHDIYAAGSTNDAGAELYFRMVAGQRAANRASYGGWQHQALLRDTGTNGFVDSAWLAGVGVLADGRNALAADFDSDGRVDLALTTVEGWPQVRQRLVIFRNESEPVGHWVGLRFYTGPASRSGVNARVELRTSRGVRRRWLVTGDGYRTQQTAQVHFGLGSETQLNGASVIWEDGSRTEVAIPAVDRWYAVDGRRR